MTAHDNKRSKIVHSPHMDQNEPLRHIQSLRSNANNCGFSFGKFNSGKFTIGSCQEYIHCQVTNKLTRTVILDKNNEGTIKFHVLDAFLKDK